MSKRPGDPGYAAGWCIHYRSASDHQTCEAGVRYEDLKNETPPYGIGRWPCFIRPGEDRSTLAKCDKCRPPTPEEVRLHEEWCEASFARIRLAMEAITTHANGKRGVSGNLLCPACKTGTLSYSIAGRNGHVHARCSTAQCISFMQ